MKTQRFAKKQSSHWLTAQGPSATAFWKRPLTTATARLPMQLAKVWPNVAKAKAATQPYMLRRSGPNDALTFVEHRPDRSKSGRLSRLGPLRRSARDVRHPAMDANHGRYGGATGHHRPGTRLAEL